MESKMRNFLPIETEILHELTVDCLMVEGTILRDFGCWTKGSHKILLFNFEDGTVTEFDDSGKEIVSYNIRLEIEQELVKKEE